MSVPLRTGTKFAKLGLASGALFAAALPAGLMLSTPARAADAADQARLAKGREIFNSWSCSACHTLSDAKAGGAVGPSLDGDKGLTEQLITSRVTNGQGAMPAFGGQLSKQEIADLAYYLTKVAKK